MIKKPAHGIAQNADSGHSIGQLKTVFPACQCCLCTIIA